MHKSEVVGAEKKETTQKPFNLAGIHKEGDLSQKKAESFQRCGQNHCISKTTQT